MEDIEVRAKEFRDDFNRLVDEVGKVIVGHRDIIEGVLIALFAGGHCLLEGVPGLGKTFLVRTLSQVLNLKFSRIQFTPDLMPADIVGTNIVVEGESGKCFEFQPGPVFAQILLADEINRATPKTQSAMLEAMQEKHVTSGNTTYNLDKPFFVLATQNPLEMEGTYPLPEAQLDRFFFKLMVEYSSREELKTILDRTTEAKVPEVEKVMDGGKITEYMDLVKEIVVADHVKDFAVRLILATHPGGEYAPPMTNKYVRVGSSPRGAQALNLGGKIRALLDGRYNVSFEDIAECAVPALRHRIILNFEGEAEGIEADDILREIIEKTPHTTGAPV